MLSEPEGRFHGSEQEFYRNLQEEQQESQQMLSEPEGRLYEPTQEFYSNLQGEKVYETPALRRRKIDPMGLLGRVFAIVGAILTVVGILVASLLGWFNPGEMGVGFYFMVTAGAWGTGLIFLLLGSAFLLLFRNMPSANVVDQYFAAFVNQDYATAFQYLAPGLRTPLGEAATLTWLTQRAQAYDANGKITDYALRGFGSYGRNIWYRVRVTRGARSYVIKILLERRGDSWKITSFSTF